MKESTAPTAVPSSGDGRDDHLLAPTRWTAIAIVPVLSAAFVILFLFPGRTRQLWAWTIHPSMSALMMGAGYGGGAYFFTRVATTRAWHRVSPGFVAITVFTSLLMVATIVHWDRFNHGHVSFWAWLVLYATTPVLLPVLWARNQRTDPRTLAPPDTVVPRPLRLVIGVGGALQLAFAGLMFFAPATAAKAWAWPLTTLTSRSLSAFVAFPAVIWLWFLVEERWSSFRIVVQLIAVGLVLIGVAALRAGDDFRTPAWHELYLAALVVALALTVGLHIAMDRLAARSTA